MAKMLSAVIRNEIAENKDLGAGNFLFIACATIPAPAAPFWYLQPADQLLLNGESRAALSVNDVIDISARLAAWYARRELKAGDRVGLYLGNGLDYFFHYFALTRLGLVPVWLNANLPVDVAGSFLRHVGVALALTDSDRVGALAAELDGQCRVEAGRDGSMAAAAVPPPPHRHGADEIVLVCHSSGTTGMPKPVLYRHESMCYGIRQFLSDPPEFAAAPTRDGRHRLLSALPPAHHSSLTYFMRALLSQMDFMTLGRPDPAGIGAAIGQFQPSVVMSFPCHYVSLVALNQDAKRHDLDSVSWWLSVGDAAHRPHIRELVRYGYHSAGDGFKDGSMFIDGLGSSEMGSIFFRLQHGPQDDHPLRCIGRPLKWIEAALLSDSGDVLPPHVVGRLGVRAPTLAGYWQKAEMESASWVSGYFLTGDLAYRDDEGRYYHVDRTSDAIPTADGVLYTALAEETILHACADVDDCVVVGVPDEDAQGLQKAAVFLAMKPAAQAKEGVLLDKINTALAMDGQRTLDYIRLTDLAALPTGPTGKIQKNKLRAALAATAKDDLGQPCR